MVQCHNMLRCDTSSRRRADGLNTRPKVGASDGALPTPIPSERTSLMRASLLLAALIATSLPMRAHSQPAGVLSYHGSPERSGHFVVPGLTWERARSLHLDQNFHARVVRLAPDLHRSTNKRDFFAPPDWHALD